MGQVLLAKQPRDRRRLARRGRREHGRERRTGGIGCGGANRGRLALSTRGGCADAGGDGVRERPESGVRAVHELESEFGHVNAQSLAQATERIRLTSAEGVGGDIRVAEGDDRDSAAGERAQDRDSRLRRLLQVVDEHETEARDTVVGKRAVDRRHGEPRQFGRVVLVLAVERLHCQVLGDEVRRGHPLRAIGLATELPHPFRRHPVFGRASHELAQFGAEAAQAAHVGVEGVGPGWAGARLDVALEERPEVGVLLATAEQPGNRSTGRLRRRPDELKGEGGDGSGERSVGRPVEPEREHVAESSGRGAG